MIFIQDLNDCLPNPCKNNGMCLDGDGKFTCKCASGWSGKLNDLISYFEMNQFSSYIVYN